MNTYRHQNGGGLKVYPAQASPDCSLDKNSTIEGETSLSYMCVVRDSAVKDTFAAGYVVIRHSLLADARLSHARADNSDIVRTEIVMAQVNGCRLSDSRIYGGKDGEPYLEQVSLKGVHVSGSAELYGPWGLNLPGAHIHAGEWEEPPRHLAIEGEGVHVAVLECTDGRAHMGCACRPVSHWLAKGPRLARRLGWNEEQIERCLNFLRSL